MTITTEPIWHPPKNQASDIRKYMSFLKTNLGLEFQSYADLHRWSVENKEAFWHSISEHCNVIWKSKSDLVYKADQRHRMLGGQWFPGSKLNFAENLLELNKEQTIVAYVEGISKEVRWGNVDLKCAVSSIQKHINTLGVGKGDRVAAVSSNTHLSLAGMLATTASGAIWASCSPDFGIQAVVDRMSQIKPTLLFYTPEYVYNGKRFDRLPLLPKILDSIPSIESVIILDHLEAATEITLNVPHVKVSELISESSDRNIDYCHLPFDHPLYILFSSGTTGIPKCIVHSAGGTLLQHKKELMLHGGVCEESKLFYFTTCGWMMWNWMVSSLSTGADLVLYDGSVTKPDSKVLWDLIQKEKVTHFGTSPKYLSYCESQSLVPKKVVDLSKLKTVFSTGAPLMSEQFDWVYQNVSSNVHLASICGGTDIVSCFILGNPDLPVHRGEIQCLGLGMAVECWDANGKAKIGQKGELVCVEPFPSMPIGFWDDDDQKKYRSSYFEYYEREQVWRHGDLIEITERGSIVVYGRSDATLNPGGVRIGTAELYRVLEKINFIEDSIVVSVSNKGDSEIWLFVKSACSLPDKWRDEIKKKVVSELSPRHAPSKIEVVSDIPYTRSGKKVEIPVSRLLNGQEVENLGALENPEALEEFRKYSLK